MSAFTKAIRDEFRENPRSSTLAAIGLAVTIGLSIWAISIGYWWFFAVLGVVAVMSSVQVWAESADRKRRKS